MPKKKKKTVRKKPIKKKQKKEDKRIIYFLLLFIFLSGAFMRIFPTTLYHIPLRHDSYYHVRVAELVQETGSLPLWEPWPYGGRPHTYPPMYHVTLAGLSTLTGIPISEIIRFILPVVSSFIIIAVFLLVRKFRDDKTALFASLFIAINPYMISSAYDSPQVIGILIGCLLLYFFIKKQFIKTGIALAAIYSFNPFSAICFAIPLFVSLMVRRDTINTIKVFISPGLVILAWFLPRLHLTYCSDTFIGSFFIMKGVGFSMWSEAILVFIVLAVSFLIMRFFSSYKFDRFGKVFVFWVLVFSLLYFSFIVTPIFHPWRQGIFLAFGFSIFMADVLMRIRRPPLRVFFVFLYIFTLLTGLITLVNLNDFGPALEENELLMMRWADTTFPQTALILAHHDICSNVLALTNRTCLLDISFECIEDKEAWYSYENLFWTNDSKEIQTVLNFYPMTHILYRSSSLNNEILEKTNVNKIYSSWQCEPPYIDSKQCYKDAASYKVIRQDDFVIRLDDIWSIEHTADNDYGFNIENLNAIVSVIEQNSMTGTLAVTPFFHESQTVLAENQKTVGLINNLKDKGWEIVLHGYSHNCPVSDKCEFDEKTVEENTAMVKEGKEYLEDLFNITIDKFVAPKERVPQSLSRALNGLGIQLITDAKLYDPIEEWYWPDIKWSGFEEYSDYYNGIVLHYNVITAEKLAELDEFLMQKASQ